MNRRNLLGAILATGFAPAAIGSGVLMPIRRPMVYGTPGLSIWPPIQSFGFEVGDIVEVTSPVETLAYVCRRDRRGELVFWPA